MTAAVSKKGSRIQVVSNTKSPRSRSPIRSLSSRTGSSMPKLGGMRCDMEEHQTKKRKWMKSYFCGYLWCVSAAIQRTNVSRTNVRNMTFKVESRENEFIGIDLKKVSLKRKIKNDDSTTEVRPNSNRISTDRIAVFLWTDQDMNPNRNLTRCYLDRWVRWNQAHSCEQKREKAFIWRRNCTEEVIKISNWEGKG